MYSFDSRQSLEGPLEEFGSDEFSPLCKIPINFKKTLMNLWSEINSVLVFWVIICFDCMSF